METCLPPVDSTAGFAMISTPVNAKAAPADVSAENALPAGTTRTATLPNAPRNGAIKPARSARTCPAQC